MLGSCEDLDFCIRVWISPRSLLRFKAPFWRSRWFRLGVGLQPPWAYSSTPLRARVHEGRGGAGDAHGRGRDRDAGAGGRARAAGAGAGAVAAAAEAAAPAPAPAPARATVEVAVAGAGDGGSGRLRRAALAARGGDMQTDGPRRGGE